jgi:putative ABC transport system permease protein
MSGFGSDLRLSARSLRRSPLFTFPVVITLALAIGAACAMFSLLWALVLRPLPFADASRLVAIFGTKPGRGQLWLSLADLRDLSAQSPSLQMSAAYRDRTFTLDSGNGDLPVVDAGMVTPDFFETLGVHPALGRTLAREDGRAGAPKVAFLTHALWRTRFAGDPAVIGRTLRLNDESRVIAGVLPANFELDASGRRPDLYIALEGYEGRDVRAFSALGRLRPGATLAQAQQELATVAARLAAEYPETNSKWSAGAADLHRALVGDRAQPMLLLMAAVSLLFLIALFNVANLVLARATARLRESAIRTGLGASQARELRRYLAEGALLAVLGGGLGALLGSALLPVLSSSDRLIPEGQVRAMVAQVQAGWPALAFGAGLTALTVLVCAVAPLWLQRGADLQRLLQQGAGALRRSGRTPRGALMVGEVALSAVLLVFTSLFLRSLLGLLAVNPGFTAANVVTFGIGLPEIRYDTEAKQAAFFELLLARLRVLPGVESASGIFGLPMSNAKAGTWVQREGSQAEGDERPRAVLGFAAPGYFETLRIPLLAGRSIGPGDGFDAPPVCVISAALARAQFGSENPIGQRLLVAAASDHAPKGTRWTVVGVAGDVRQTDLATAPMPQIYLPFKQFPGETLQIVLRSATPAPALAEALRAAVRSLDGNLERLEPQSLTAQLALTTAGRRSAVMLLLSFAALALILTAVGLYGVISLLVAQRRREFGIRIALGAQARQVLSLVLIAGVRLSLIGLSLGAAVAAAGTRLVQSQIVGVSAGDPRAYFSAGALLLSVALLACALPAVRASRVDPMVVLRDE